jgi:hypothetical protein
MLFLKLYHSTRTLLKRIILKLLCQTLRVTIFKDRLYWSSSSNPKASLTISLGWPIAGVADCQGDQTPCGLAYFTSVSTMHPAKAQLLHRKADTSYLGHRSACMTWHRNQKPTFCPCWHPCHCQGPSEGLAVVAHLWNNDFSRKRVCLWHDDSIIRALWGSCHSLYL